MKNTFFRILSIVLLSFFPLSSSAYQIDDGWRLPEKKDEIGNWTPGGSNERAYIAHADFNGDGIEDVAFIALPVEGSGWALFVNLNLKTGSSQIIKLVENHNNIKPQIMGVAVVYPGEYKTACGKGYWECKGNEPSELKLDLPGINYYCFEGASSFFWWDKATSKFIRTWISD
jgi:hypothetical protein